MSRARLPVGAPPKTKDSARRDEETLGRAQAGTLKWVEGRLRRRGLTDGRIAALAVAYVERGAAKRIVREVEREWKQRVPALTKVLEMEEANHAVLHTFLGGRRTWFNLAPPVRGAQSRRVDSLRTEPCDLSNECDASSFEEVRQHAVFCRWLRAQIENFRHMKRDPTSMREDLRRDIEERGAELLSKGAILKLLVDDAGLSPRHVALFILARGMDLPLPISEDRLVTEAHAISVALSASRDCQVRTERRRKT